MSDYLKDLLEGFSLPLTNPVLVFSLILFIILLSPILLKRLNIPGIIGLIISGVIIGPRGFNLLEKNSAVELFSTIGLLYIMFIAGLELELNEFKANKYKSIVFGILTFIIPFGIGLPFSYFILEYNTDATLLISCMFATQTLVAYPIVSKLGVSKNQAVAITVGGTILTDTAVLLFLAVIMGSHQGNLNQEFWIRLAVSLIIFLAIIFLIIPRITKWFFSKLESEKHAHYIFVLSVVFLSAFLAEVAGVEPIIGAFVAGLALNPLIPRSSALMNRIEFIGNSLFIPFFLISVGMIIDVRVLLKGPEALFIALSLTAVALLGKWIAAYLTQVLFKYSKEQRNLIFGLSSSHAAAILAVILVGFKAGILDENVLNGTIILILITCIVASFVTERAAKKIALTGQDDVSDLPGDHANNNDNILVPISNISSIEKLLELSVLIKNKKSNTPITILSVVPNNEQAEINLLNTRKSLENYVAQGAASEISVRTIATIDHNPVGGIARTSREIMANIVVLGWPKKASLFDRLVGEKIQFIINTVEKNLFICFMNRSIISQKRIVLITPPLSEREDGFELWLSKTAMLSSELQIPVVHFGNESTHSAIRNFKNKKHLNFTLSYHNLENWEDTLFLSRLINDEDLVILISARKNSVSYISILDSLPLKLEKYFANNNKIIVFPQQRNPHENVNYSDISSKPIEISLEAIEQLGKSIGNVFKKEQ